MAPHPIEYMQKAWEQKFRGFKEHGVVGNKLTIRAKPGFYNSRASHPDSSRGDMEDFMKNRGLKYMGSIGGRPWMRGPLLPWTFTWVVGEGESQQFLELKEDLQEVVESTI